MAAAGTPTRRNGSVRDACKSTAAAQSLTSLPHTRTVPAGEDTTPFAKWLPSSVTYLNSKFDEKETVKALGAKWDPVKRQWYVPSGVDTTPFAKWLPGGASASAPSAASPVATGAGPTNGSTSTATTDVPSNVTYLNSTFDEKDTVKALGARWDSKAVKWYVPNGMDTAPFAKWIPPAV